MALAVDVSCGLEARPSLLSELTCEGLRHSIRQVQDTCVDHPAWAQPPLSVYGIPKIQRTFQLHILPLDPHVPHETWGRGFEPSKTKQIDLSCHHVRDEVAKGRIKIIPVPSSLNLADPLTKGLKCDQHEFLNEVIFWLQVA